MSQFRKVLLSLLLLSTSLVHIYAQEACGFQPSPEQIAHFDRNRSQRQQFNALRSSTVRWLPIQFHEGIATSGTNATPRINYDLINSHLAALNQLFAPYNIQFFECAIKKDIANNTLFGFDSSEEPQLAPYETPNVINVYFFHTVSYNGNLVCGYSYLPPSADRVFISKGCTEQAIFLHEMGHYLGLYHTHGKTNGLTDELVNGSNCATAGDEICDTPADPNLNTGVMYGCNYIGQGRDINGDLYQPDPTNLMSYSHVSCKNRFSPQQLNRMAYTALHDRAYLTGCNQPNACENPLSTLPQHFDFETGLENWSNGWFTPEGHIPFVRGSGATPNLNTGPNAAYSGNFYTYLESSQDTGNYYRYGFLESPCFDLRGYTSPKMSFRYHAVGNSVFELGVGASRNGGATWDSLLFSVYLVSNNGWQEVVCNLSPFIDAPLVQFGILAAIIQGNQGDIAIDDIRFYNDTSANCNLTLTPTLIAPSCSGGSNGQILVQSAGGSGAISYTWSNGGSTNAINALNAGTYSVTATDSLGCTLSAAYTLQEPPVLQVNLTSTHVSVAGQSNGAISTTASGGTVPYYYTWSNGATSAGINNLSAGTYTVTVIDSKDCQQVRTVVITEPANGCGTMYSTFPWSSSFESNFLIFERVMGYQTNWVRRNSATPNANTGPDAAHQGNYYTFINSSHPNRTAVLQTEKCLNLSAVVSPVLKFHYHMYGAQMGTLFVEISTNNGASWNTVWSLSGNQGNQWHQANVDLQPYQSSSIRIRFRGVTASNTSDMALDALHIGPAGGSNASLAEIVPVKVQIKPTLSIYPNPSPGLVNFKVSNAQTVSKLELYSAAGQKICQGVNDLPEQSIDLSNQAEGLYIARAWINGQIVVSKFLIQRN